MDSINWLGGANFPNSSQTMAMLQGMVQLAGSMGFLGGDNYILKGCVDRAGIVSDGLIVIEGVPYVFEGGSKKAKVTIRKVNETLSAFGKEYPEARTKRTVVFADNGEYLWDDFKQVLTNKELEKRFENIKGTPYGIAEIYTGYLDKIPENYRLCDGSILSIDEYSELHKVIGTIHGGEGLAGFALPDMRKLFIVGYDNAEEDYNAIGKKGGKKEVELLKDNLPDHDHTDRDGTAFNKLSARAADVDATNTPGTIDDKTPDAEYRVGGMTTLQWAESTIRKVGKNIPHENRPPYFVAAYIMRVKD